MPTGTNPTPQPSLTPTQKFIADLQADNVRQQAKLVKEQEQIVAFNAKQDEREETFTIAQTARNSNFTIAQASRLSTFTEKSNSDIAAINARITQNNASLASLGA